MLYVFLPPKWMRELHPQMVPKQLDCTLAEALEYNVQGYGVFYYPNGVSPEAYDRIPLNPKTGRKTFVQAHDVDTFHYVYVDMDLKDGTHATKDDFIATLADFLPPTSVVDSGRGVHAFWRVSDLDAISFLKLNRRLCRRLKTDPAVSQLKQLMRVPGTVNTKDTENPSLCEELYRDDTAGYTCEALDAALPALTAEDEEHCRQHYEKAYNLQDKAATVNDKIPAKFAKLLRDNKEVKDIWSGNVNDRSVSDMRLGHIMWASGFTKDEARSVLVNASKALSRAPIHRLNYADNIVEKIWIAEDETANDSLYAGSTVTDILSSSGEVLGPRLPCWTYLDNTVCGFRRGQVIGLVAGSGVGKTSVALNMFLGFVQNNPDLDHFFFSLEQPVGEIAERWKTMCGDNTRLHDKVHIIGNHQKDGTFRNLSMDDLRKCVLEFKADTGKDVGCVVVDNFGMLANEDRNGQGDGAIKLCKQMKSFALETETLLVMQSNTAREKAGIGDLELNKDAAFGTSVFENNTDYMITLWQPLKRCYEQGAPLVCAYKFCKIRHKKAHKDVIREDVRYALIYDPETERLRELTEAEEKAFDFFKTQAANLRKQDRKTEVVPYKSVRWETKATSGAA